MIAIKRANALPNLALKKTDALNAGLSLPVLFPVEVTAAVA